LGSCPVSIAVWQLATRWHLQLPMKITQGQPHSDALSRCGVVPVVFRHRGFSLLELLVALFVIVLITSMVSFNFTSGGQEIELESRVRNLASVGAYALDEAQMSGIDYGLLLEERLEGREVIYRYQWLERALDGWQTPASGKDLFETQAMAPGISLQLELEDAPLVELSLEDEGSDIVAPQVVFYASGETTVGAIDVVRTDDGELLWRIEWDLLGRFEVMRRGRPDDEDLQ
jgi:general secretion pathway protein H